MSAGPPRLLGGLYVLFAVAAGARSAYQLATRFGDAPLPYALSAAAAAVYVVAAVAVRTDRRALLAGAAAVELAGVLAVGALTLADRGAFPDETVWSRFGQGLRLPAARPADRRAGVAGRGSGVGHPVEQRHRPAQEVALIGVELAVERLREPVLAPRAGGEQRLEAGIGELDEVAATVRRVRAARDEARVLEVAHGLRHRLRAHAVGGGQVADARRALAVQAAEHRELPDRRAGLGAEPAQDAADGLAQVVGELGGGCLGALHGRQV
jgi:hypothetical protein